MHAILVLTQKIMNTTIIINMENHATIELVCIYWVLITFMQKLLIIFRQMQYYMTNLL